MWRIVISALSLLLLPVVALAQSSPSVMIAPFATQRVARGAQRVRMLRIAVTASCRADTVVESLEIARLGRGLRSDIAAVYLLRGEQRVSSVAQFSSRDERVTLRPRRLRVPACGEAVLDVAVDFEEEALSGGEHRLRLMRIGTADLGGGWSLLPAGEAGPATVTPIIFGNVTVVFRSFTPTVQAGNRVLARFEVIVDRETDQEISSITLTNGGSAREGDLANLYLRSRGERVTDVASSMIRKQVQLTFAPALRIGAGESRLLELVGRVLHKRSVQFRVEEQSDIVFQPSRAQRH